MSTSDQCPAVVSGPNVNYEVSDRVARITLNRPARGNGLTRALIEELALCVERADLDPSVHVLLLAGNGKGFCGGYDLVDSAEGLTGGDLDDRAGPPGSPLDPQVLAANHDPRGVWDPMVDYAMMSRNVRAFMALVHCGKPVVCRVHGFCVVAAPIWRSARTCCSSPPTRRSATRPPACGDRPPPPCGHSAWALNGPSGCCSPGTA